jgi:hypothetical protein
LKLLVDFPTFLFVTGLSVVVTVQIGNAEPSGGFEFVAGHAELSADNPARFEGTQPNLAGSARTTTGASTGGDPIGEVAAPGNVYRPLAGPVWEADATRDGSVVIRTSEGAGLIDGRCDFNCQFAGGVGIRATDRQ